MSRFPQLLAYAQLMRLPNVFTAFADIALAGALTGAISTNPGAWSLVLLASGCLYVSGMIWNDVCDRHEDAKTQPFRPIPSGRVRLRNACFLGTVMMAMGLILSCLARELSWPSGTLPLSSVASPISVAGVLAVCILLYDIWLKWTPIGPLGMGLCRFLNVLFGLSISDTPFHEDNLSLHVAGVVGVYIVGVTWFARTEETDSSRRNLILAASVMALSLVLALLLPLHRKPGEMAWFFPYLLVLFGFHIGVPIARAVHYRDPKNVQTAVKRCILGLVVLDAVLATAFVGLPGLSILLLLLPARFLGRWVYST